MKIFLAGASGALGRRLVPLLIGRGHGVTGTTRSGKKAAEIRGMGAEAVVLDALTARQSAGQSRQRGRKWWCMN